MEEMKRRLGHAYVQAPKPIAMGIALVKVACNCALLQFKAAMGPAFGPARFAVETKRVYTLLQWAKHMDLEARLSLACASLNNINAYGEIERECIDAAITSSPYIHSRLPLFDLVYKRGACELCYNERQLHTWDTEQKRGPPRLRPRYVSFLSYDITNILAAMGSNGRKRRPRLLR
jgi:hypothetical protein